MEKAKFAGGQSDVVSEHVQLEKLDRLEQEYLRLTHTQNNAEVNDSSYDHLYMFHVFISDLQ